jgi:hypothetical protein
VRSASRNVSVILFLCRFKTRWKSHGFLTFDGFSLLGFEILNLSRVEWSFQKMRHQFPPFCNHFNHAKEETATDHNFRGVFFSAVEVKQAVLLFFCQKNCFFDQNGETYRVMSCNATSLLKSHSPHFHTTRFCCERQAILGRSRSC